MSAGQSGVMGTLPVVLNLTQLEALNRSIAGPETNSPGRAKIMPWAVGTKLLYISLEYLDSSLY